jgi:hypothetical protein
MKPLVAIESAAYGAAQAAWSAWAARRYCRDFDRVRAFCLFVGYPRSGHSLVGAFLNAHRHAVVSHELDAPPLVLAGCTRDQLYARILARAGWFHLRGDRSNFPYRVPGQWQGRFEELRLIGDKRGGAVTRCIAAHPDFLDRVRRLVGVPLRLVHVVRNPFDNVAAISLWHDLSLDDSIDYYFTHCATTARLPELCAEGELLTLRHEDLVRDPRATLAALAGFAGLDAEPAWVDACASIVFPAPTGSRRRIQWPDATVREVTERVGSFPFLRRYAFAASEPSGRPAPAAPPEGAAARRVDHPIG